MKRITKWPWNIITSISVMAIVGIVIHALGDITGPLIGFLGTLVTISALIFTILQQIEIGSRINQMRADHFNPHCQSCINLIDKILLSQMKNIDTVDFMLRIIDDYLEECHLSCNNDIKEKISKLIRRLSGRLTDIRVCKQRNIDLDSQKLDKELSYIKKQMKNLISSRFVH